MGESTSLSWWFDARTRPPYQSPWLQAILSDLDEKIKSIVNLIEDEGDSFTERAELFYKRRPELLKILRELHQSYQYLAESYDKIRSVESARVAQLRSPYSSLRFQQMSISRLKAEEESPNSDPPSQSSGADAADLKVGEESIPKGNTENEEEENLWEEAKPKVSKLIEDNMRQQMELIRRNDEKREMIKQLRGQISRLMEENRSMKSLISGYNAEFKQNDCNNFKLKGLSCLGSFQDPN